ncbi:ATP-dependent RNA helicase [Gracilinema caldarium]|uniref:ATP-dependent helicase HrpB n=1 Tax=Gracilinema caldarium (strain ATCC 51460 / DSM 7334 / H1) TaxID=744872 RepID=F8EXP0_GRAC1|nr:ATP-dependent helicase C-terminal domain-containing protein [Gracilinema caldarium]AEJ19621.1 ATP-dependent helicase HrpB [Gracilinema caldarium DSM 7334]
MTIQERLSQTALPLVPWLPDIVRTLQEKRRLILRSEPGSGKSTLVPLALLEQPGSIVMLEPRRIAAIGIANRMAELLEEPVGQTVGYAVRMERRVSAATRIEVLTEGLLVRRLQSNPELPGVSTIIFDEFHERSLFTDLSFALVLDLCRIKSDLKILVMSATLDCGAIAERINESEGREGPDRVPILECPGNLFPIETEYQSLKIGESTVQCCARTLHNLIDEMTTQGGSRGSSYVSHQRDAAKGLDSQHKPAILVFLPGKGEIRSVVEVLGDVGPEWEVLPLHGSLPLAEQRRVLQGAGPGKGRIILSTNIAETSLTVPDVSIVVDTGLVRLQRYHLRTGMDRLSLDLASTQSVDQRRGRAGRLGPGRCIRLWAPQDERPAFAEPEIRRLDLASLVLECALWGAAEPENLPWLEMPPRPAWDGAKQLLIDLGALDRQGKPTQRGKQIAYLALHPRLAMLALAGLEGGNPVLGAVLAALLSERDPSGIENEADIRLRLEAFSDASQRVRFRFVIDLAEDILNRLGRHEHHTTQETETTQSMPSGTKNQSFNKDTSGQFFHCTQAMMEEAGELLARAFPDRIGKRQESGVYRFMSGREASLRGRLIHSEWVVAPDMDAGDRNGVIYLAAPLPEPLAMELLAPHVSKELSIIWNGLVPKARETTMAGRLVIREEIRKCDPAELKGALPALLKREGLDILPWDEEAEAYTGSQQLRGQQPHHGPRQKATARQLLDRIRFWIQHQSGEDGPQRSRQWTDESLIAEADEWLGPFIWNGKSNGSGPIITASSLYHALTERLGWTALHHLDESVPPLFISPAGTARWIDYHSGEPIVSLKIQEVYGLSESPLIMGIPLTFELLSPAGRPIQITRDLGHFWTGSYAEVRKEMRGRYPKHDWPEDPSHAPAHTQVHSRVAKS